MRMDSMLGASRGGRTGQPIEPTTADVRLDSERLRRLFVQLERPFAELLSPAMRARVVVRLVRCEPRTYGRLLLDATPPTCFSVLRSARWEGRGILELEVPLLRSLVERWLGGSGDTVYSASPGPTEIELRLANRLIHLLLGAWHSAWPTVGPVDWSIEQLTTQPAKIHAWSEQANFVVSSFEVVVGNVMGWLRIAIPADILTLMFQVVESRDVSPAPRGPQMAAGELVISSAPIDLSMDDWQALEEGDILTTDHARHQPWEAIFAGEAKTLVRLGTVNGRLAVQPLGHG